MLDCPKSRGLYGNFYPWNTRPNDKSYLEGYKQLSSASHVQALQEGALKLLGGYMTQQQLSWLEGHLAEHQGDCQPLITFLTGISSTGYEYPEQDYGSLALVQQVGYAFET